MIRWGIIGCGDVTEVKSGPALQQAADSAVVAVMRRDPARAEDYARRHGVPRWYSDAQALIADPGVDAVYVATPPGSHAQYAIAAMRAGKPVYVEKPMARTADECEAMLAGSHETGQPLFVAYYRRALPRFLKVRELLAAVAIGRPRRIRILLHRQAPSLAQGVLPWRLQPELSGGGLFVDLGSHTLDLLDFLFGPLQGIQSEVRNVSGLSTAEDLVRMRFRCGDVEGEGEWNFSSDARRDLVEIEGERGLLRFASFDEQPVVLRSARRDEAFSIAHPPHIQRPLIDAVLAQLRGEGRSPSTGETAARTSRVIDAVLRDYRNAASAAAGHPAALR